MQDYGIDEYQQTVQRVCKECGQRYTIGKYLENSPLYFGPPWKYRAGCETYCLACWLCVGPNDFPSAANDNPQSVSETSSLSDPMLSEDNLHLNALGGDWSYDKAYEPLMQGNLLVAFRSLLDNGANLVAMPIARVNVENTIVFPGPVTFYPPGFVDLEKLNLIPNDEQSRSLAEHSSAASGITLDVLERHPLVVIPCRFDWEKFSKSSHRGHLEFIRELSEEIDRSCLDFVRYNTCRLEPIDDLPAHAGQIATNHMMAGALLYSGALRKARIIGGAVFTHYLTRGLGLPLTQLEWDSFPMDGTTGQIARQALSLYASLLESDNPTARFMQALSLLEFLAYPDEYKKFEEVKKVIARYIAQDPNEYRRLLDRFFELTGKKDPDTGRIIGYRTKVVHMGERIERLVPDREVRKNLFLELDGYIRHVIDHLIAHSEMTFEEYLKIRDSLRPF